MIDFAFGFVGGAAVAYYFRGAVTVVIDYLRGLFASTPAE
jgi:hypothetical protein